MKTRIVLVAMLAAAVSFAQERWVGTWAASPQQPRPAVAPPKPAATQTIQVTPGQVTVGQTPAGQTIQGGIVVQPSVIPGGGAPPQALASNGGGPPAPPPSTFNNQTIRMIVHTSIPGRRARVQLSNSHGTAPLVVGAVHIALRAKGSEIVAGSDRALTFSGRPTAWIPAGASVVSDAVDLNVPADADLSVSVYIPGDSGPATMHATGLHTNYIANGNVTGDASIADARTTQSWYWLSSVEVLAPPETAAVVTFGDSITDGARSTPDTDRSWPSQLAKRLKENGVNNVAVLNHGISGNRVLRDGAGINALARFDRDVLAMPGVKWVMLLEGINDIGQGARANANPNDAVDADMLIAAMRQLVERAHAHGIKVIGCTVLPYEGAAYYSENGEVIRQAVNQFIRNGGVFDAVVDFDAVTRDPANPKRFRPEHDSGDHLHPGDAGYKAMADAIDLSLFGKAK
jgi:lysophospholipase L1-like esterase